LTFKFAEMKLRLLGELRVFEKVVLWIGYCFRLIPFDPVDFI